MNRYLEGCQMRRWLGLSFLIRKDKINKKILMRGHAKANNNRAKYM